MNLPSNPLSRSNPIAFVATADRDRARAFYAETLGLPVLAEDDFAVTFRMGEGGTTMRLTAVPGHQPLPHTVLGWAVDDVRGAVAALRGKGVTFNVYEGLGQDADGIWQAPGGARVCWFPDPDGNVLSLTQF
ncbi:putative enzyme related to lactoylglutathione lyase [Novosphingobium sp. PhB165]|uniref:VOC family protein n=1 Tax=Novosphingobium sp. PhB165 TaxID=2485105 RepID=UPI001044ACD0|nr:VOC family protein [Novosphingobium sp. PhB165]TCM16902.1 putative enzyme related to lactoylglutathione lyase [Novosphingobium sp. PhB165]